MRYEGSCHCGKIAFAVEGEIGPVTDCNCSICTKRGALLWFVPRSALQLTTPESSLSTYTFNKHRIRHHFCANCGVAPFAEGSDGKGNAMAAVNVRALEGVDLAALERKSFDGRSL